MKVDLLRHRIFLFGILLLVISLPTSKFGMSLSQMILAANWLIDKRILIKFKEFFTNKVALAFSLLFFVHLLWLANTSNFNYAMDDLRTKSPIFILAIIFATTPILSAKEFRLVLFTHVFGVLLMSFISVYIFYSQHPTDFRLISPYISHIRLSLHVCISIFTLLYFLLFQPMEVIKNKRLSIALKVGFVLLILWFVNFISLLQSVIGIGIILTIVVVLLLQFVINISKKGLLKKAIIALIILIPISIGWFLTYSFNYYMYKPTIDLSALDKVSSHGGIYRHDTINFTTENQKWIGLYFCEPELAYGWNMRSSVKYNTKDAQGNIVNYTLLRYLTSKDLRKDIDGVNALTDKDVKNIEQGIANINYTHGFGILSRLHKLYWEYLINTTNGDIKGHSMSQRVELWKISGTLIKKHWLTGVGTGDVPDVFKQQLIADNSPLKETRMRSHNQFLSLFIAFGIFGFVLCLFSFLYPFYKSKQLFDYFCMIFLIVFFVSMLTEDTIESQDGVTFFAFFAAFYLFQKPLNSKILQNKGKNEKN